VTFDETLTGGENNDLSKAEQKTKSFKALMVMIPLKVRVGVIISTWKR
jgi:hypothetical protein